METRLSHSEESTAVEGFLGPELLILSCLFCVDRLTEGVRMLWLLLCLLTPMGMSKIATHGITSKERHIHGESEDMIGNFSNLYSSESRIGLYISMPGNRKIDIIHHRRVQNIMNEEIISFTVHSSSASLELKS